MLKQFLVPTRGGSAKVSQFLIPEYHGMIDINLPTSEDIVFYMYRAYKECYFSDIAPGLFEFFDNFTDQIHLSDRNSFLFRGTVLSKYELGNPYFVEFLLEDYQFMYMSLNDHECCDCQNILIQEMIDNE
jgi:hypothetical protein